MCIRSSCSLQHNLFYTLRILNHEIGDFFSFDVWHFHVSVCECVCAHVSLFDFWSSRLLYMNFNDSIFDEVKLFLTVPDWPWCGFRKWLSNHLVKLIFRLVLLSVHFWHKITSYCQQPIRMRLNLTYDLCFSCRALLLTGETLYEARLITKK